MVINIYRVVFLMVLQKTVFCFECTDFYTIFEETCDPTNHTFKPGIDPPTFKPSSKFDLSYGDCTDTLPQACFLQLSCDIIETSCESIATSTVKTPETTIHETEGNFTTVSEYPETIPTTGYTPTSKYMPTSEYILSEYKPTTEKDKGTITEDITITHRIKKEDIEGREFYTVAEETICNDGGPIIIINPVPMNKYLKTWNASSSDDCEEYPLDSYLELACEDIVTSCRKMGGTGSLKSDPPITPPHIPDKTLLAATYALIAIGSVACITLVTYTGYFVTQKIIDIIQSNTYRLPQ